jgi:hypothetical protein
VDDMSVANNKDKFGNSKKRWIVISGTILLLPVVLFALVAYTALSILGPWDQPRFENKDWDLLEVRYWLVQGQRKEIPRDFAIEGNDLAELKQLFSTKESVGVSTPNPSFLNLKLSNGQRWKIHFSTANTLRFCLLSDTYYAYHVTLNDTKFFEKLREYCLKHEQKHFTPHARIENISVCTHRWIVDQSKLPTIQQPFVGEFIIIGLRGEFSAVCVPLEVSERDEEKATDGDF